jgi:glycosyltransferase involved in cell wall biosynthesis
LSAVIAIWKELKSIKTEDILLAADIRAGIASTIIRLLRPFSKILMFHGGEIKRASYSSFARWSNVLSAALAQKCVANSSYTASLVRRYLGRNADVTLLGVSPYWFEAPAGGFENQVLRDLDPDVPVVCTVARLESRKGHLVAIRALQELSRRRAGFDFRYIICGKAVYEDYAAQVRRAVGEFSDRCVYVGQLSRSDVRRLYARSSVMLLAAQEEPGFIEGFGLVITEAGAQRCPSVSTRVGGIADAIADGVTGLLCRPDDIQSLSRSVEHFLTDRRERDAFGARARDFAANLTWISTARRTIEGLLTR